MKLIHPNTSNPTSTTQFIHLNFNNNHTINFRKSHQFSFFTPLALKTPLILQQPPKYNHTITSSPQQKQQINQIKNINANKNNTTIDVLRLMDALKLVVTPDIYATLVYECTRNHDVEQTLDLYDHMKSNAKMVNYLKLSSGLLLFNRILLMLVSCGCFEVAHQVFDEMCHRNFVSLAILLGGFVDKSLFEEALGLFVKMYKYFIYQEDDLGLEVVLVCFFKACEQLKMVNLGKTVHGWLIKMGYVDRGLGVGTALVEFYGKSGRLWEANHVFFDNVRRVYHHDTVLWTGALVNNCHKQCFKEVIMIFHEMRKAGVRMNEYTFSSVLKASGRVGDDASFGQQVHANAVKLGVDNHVFVLCGLIDLYGKWGLLREAKRVFDMVDDGKRNSACWNAMVSGYMNNGFYFDALKMLYQMKAAGLEPKQSMVDEVRLACGGMKF